MKQFYLLIASAALLLAACQMEQPVEIVSEANVNQMSFVASFGDETPGTRTQLDGSGRNVVWCPAEKIDVFRGNAHGVFTSTNVEPASVVTFTGNLSGDQGDEPYFYAVYPQSDENTFANDLIKARIPAQQVAIPGTFADSTAVIVARAAGGTNELAFKSACSGIKFQVQAQGIKKVTFTSNNDEPLAGIGTIQFNDGNGNPYIYSVSDFSNTVTLTAPKGESFIPGEWYYIVCIPTYLAQGYTMTFMSETKTGVRVSNAAVVAGRATWGKIANADANVEYHDADNLIYGPAPNEIWYYANSQLAPSNPDSFNANIVDNVWENGFGKYIFDAPVTSIGSFAFSRGVFTKLVLPEGLKDIGNRAFSHNENLREINIPESVETVAERLLADCPELEKITGKYATADGKCLIINDKLYAVALKDYSSFVVPDGVTALGRSCFEKANVSTVILPASLTTIPAYAFEYSKLQSISIPENVSTISGNPFTICYRLETISGKFASSDGRCLINDYGTVLSFAPAGLTTYSVPDGATEIGNEAFMGVSELKTLNLPASVTSLGYYSLANTLIKTLRLYSTQVVTLGPDAIYSSPNARIYVPESLVDSYKADENWSAFADRIFAIGHEPQPTVMYYTSTDGDIVNPTVSTFSGAEIVSNVYENGQGIITFDDEVTAIDAYAFQNSPTLSGITIPASVTSIGNYAFGNCRALASISFEGNGLKSIGRYAFSNTQALQEIVLPSSLETLNAYAFSNSGLITATVPEGVTFGYNPFIACHSLTRFFGPYASEDGRCLVQNGTLVSFAPSGITAYSVPEGVSTLHNYSFYNCYNLLVLDLPSSVTSINTSTAPYCQNLMTVILRANQVVSLGDSAFAEDDNCKFYVPGTLVESYKADAQWSQFADRIFPMEPVTQPTVIYYTTTDGNIITPQDETAFGAMLMSNVYENGQGAMTFMYGDVTIGQEAFYGCSTLSGITIPESVTSIGSYAFYKCNSLSSVTFNEGLKSVGMYAFAHTPSLGEVTLPASLESFGDFVFYNSNITGITFLSSNVLFGSNPLAQCPRLAYIHGPDSSADGRCLVLNGELLSFAPYGLTSYSVPDGISMLCNYSFYGSLNLTELFVPDSVTAIGTGVFTSCDAMKKIHFASLTPPTLTAASSLTNAENALFVVPAEALQTYKDAEKWNTFADRIVAEAKDHGGSNEGVGYEEW